MIVLSAKPRSGKTTFCSNNSYSTLFDRIKAQAFFGSCDFTVQAGEICVKRANSTINDSELPTAAFLDCVSLPEVGDLVYVYISKASSKVVTSNGAKDLYFQVPHGKYSYLCDAPDSLDEIDCDFYTKRGCLEPAYVKRDQYFYPFINTSHTSHYLFGTSEVVGFLYQAFYADDGLRAAALVGLAIKYKNSSQVFFGMIHSYFERGLHFTGLPYINIAEAGPSAPSGYITTGHGQSDNNYMKYRRVFAVEKTEIDQRLAVILGALATVSLTRVMPAFRGAATTGAAAHAASSTAVRGGFNVLRLGTISLAALVALPVVLDLTDYIIAKFFDEKTSVETNIPFDPASFILITNRAFFDSIIDVLYTSGGNTLTGGIPAEVIRKFINTQLHESIGIYSALGDESANKDPFHNLATDAHMAGQYSFVYKGSWPDELHFTTRNTESRYNWYKMVDSKFIYGNYCVIERKNQDVNSPYNDNCVIKCFNEPVYELSKISFDTATGDNAKKGNKIFKVMPRRLF